MKAKYKAGEQIISCDNRDYLFIIEIVSFVPGLGYEYKIIANGNKSDTFMKVGKVFKYGDTQHINENFRRNTKLDRVLK